MEYRKDAKASPHEEKAHLVSSRSATAVDAVGDVSSSTTAAESSTVQPTTASYPAGYEGLRQPTGSAAVVAAPISATAAARPASGASPSASLESLSASFSSSSRHSSPPHSPAMLYQPVLSGVSPDAAQRLLQPDAQPGCSVSSLSANGSATMAALALKAAGSTPTVRSVEAMRAVRVGVAPGAAEGVVTLSPTALGFTQQQQPRARRNSPLTPCPPGGMPSRSSPSPSRLPAHHHHHHQQQQQRQSLKPPGQSPHHPTASAGSAPTAGAVAMDGAELLSQLNPSLHFMVQSLRQGRLSDVMCPVMVLGNTKAHAAAAWAALSATWGSSSSSGHLTSSATFPAASAAAANAVPVATTVVPPSSTAEAASSPFVSASMSGDAAATTAEAPYALPLITPQTVVGLVGHGNSTNNNNNNNSSATITTTSGSCTLPASMRSDHSGSRHNFSHALLGSIMEYEGVDVDDEQARARGVGAERARAAAAMAHGDFAGTSAFGSQAPPSVAHTMAGQRLSINPFLDSFAPGGSSTAAPSLTHFSESAAQLITPWPFLYANDTAVGLLGYHKLEDVESQDLESVFRCFVYAPEGSEGKGEGDDDVSTPPPPPPLHQQQQQQRISLSSAISDGSSTMASVADLAATTTPSAARGSRLSNSGATTEAEAAHSTLKRQPPATADTPPLSLDALLRPSRQTSAASPDLASSSPAPPPQQQPASAAAAAAPSRTSFLRELHSPEELFSPGYDGYVFLYSERTASYYAALAVSTDDVDVPSRAASTAPATQLHPYMRLFGSLSKWRDANSTTAAAAAAAAAGEGSAARTAPRMSLSQPAVKETTSPSLTAPTTTTGATAATAAASTRQRLSVVSPAFCSQSKYVVLYILQRIETGKTPLVPPRPPVAKPDEKADAHDNNSSNSSGQRRVTGIYTPTSTAAATVNANAQSPAPAAAVAPLLRPDLTPIGAPLLGSDAQVDVDAPSPLRRHNIQLLQQQQQQQQQQQRPRAFSPTTTHVAADPPSSQVLRNVESGEHHSLMEVPSWTPRSSAEWNASNTNTSNTTQSDGARAALPSAVRDGNNSDANNNNNKRHSLFELSYTPFQAQLAKPGRVSSDYVADGFVAGGDGSTPSCVYSTTTTNTRQTGEGGGQGDTAVSGAGNGNDGVVAISSSGDTTGHSGPFSRHQQLSSPTTRDLNAGEGEEHAASGLRARRGQMSSLLPLAPMTHQLSGVPPTPLCSVGSLPQQAAGGNTHNNNSDTPLSGPLPLSPMQPSHVTAATVAPWKAMQEVRSVEAVAQLAQRVREASQASTDASRLGHGVSSAGTPGGSSPLASTSVTRETGSGILMNSQSPSSGGPPPASVWGRRSSRPSVGFPGTQGSGEPRPVSPRSMHSSSTTTATTHPSSHAHNAANAAAAAGRGLSRVPSRVMGSGDATGGSRSASQVLGNTAAMTWQRSNEVDQIATKKLADRIRSQRNVVTVMTSSRLPDTLIFNSVAFMIFVQQVLRFQQSNGVTQVVCLLNVRSKTQLVVDLIPMDLLDVEEGEGEESAMQGEGHKIRSRRSSPASLTGALNSAPPAAAATPSPPPISAERLEVLLRRRLARLNAFYSEEESRQTFPSRGESGQSMHNNNSSSHGSTPLIGGHLDNTHHSSNSAAEASLPLQTAKRAGSFVLSRPLDGPLKQDASTLSSSSFDQRGDGEHRAPAAAATSVTMGRASDTSHTVAPMSEPATDTDGGHHQHLQQQPRSTSPVTSVGHVTVRAADGSHKHSSRHRSSSHRDHHHHHHSCHSPNASLSSVQRQLRESRRSHTHDHKTKRESGSAAATAAAAAAAAAAAPIKSMHWAYARRTASEPIARQARSPMVMIAEAAARVTEGSRNVSRSNSFAHSGARTPPSQWASSLTSHYAVQPSSDATSAHTAAAKRESDTNSTAAALAAAAAAAVAPQPARSLLQHQRSPFNPSMVRLASDAGDSGSTSCNNTTRNSNSSINNSSSSRQNQSSRAGSSWSAQWAGSATGLQQHQRSSLPSSSQQQQQQCYPPLQWVPKSDFLSADTQQNLAMCDGDITVTARTLEAQVRIPFITPQRLELLSQLGNVQLSTYRGLSVFGVNLVNLVTEEAAAAAAQPAPPIIALQYDLAARKYKKDARAKSTVLPPFNDEDAAAQGADKAARRRRTGADATVQAGDEGNSDVAAKRHTDVRSASAAAANATASATATALSATAGGQAGLRPPALSAPPRPPGSIAAAGLALVPLDVEKDSAADRGGTAAPALTPNAASENATTNSNNNNNNRSPSQVSLFAPDHSRSPTREVHSESAAVGTPQHNSPSLPRSTVEKGCVVSLLGAAAGSARPQPPSPPPPRRLSMLSMAAAGESEEEEDDDNGAASDDAREAKTKGAGFTKASREREGQAGAQVKLGEGGGSQNNRDTHATDATGVVGTQKRKSGGLMLPMVLSDPDKAQHAADTAAVLPVATRAAASSADDTHDDSGHPLPHEQHTSHTDSAAVFSRDTQRALFPEGFPEGDNWLVQSNEQSTSLTLIAQTSSPALSVSPGSPTDRINPSQSSQAQLSVSPPPALPHPVLVCGRATSPSAHHVDPLATPASTASNTQGLVSVRTQKSGGTELLGYTLSNSAAAAFGGFSTALMKEVTLEDVKDGSSAATAAVEGRRATDADTHSSTTRRKKRESSLRTSPSSEYSHRSSQRDGDGRADQQRASAAAAAGANLSPARRATPLDPEQHPRKDNHSGSDATPTITATTTAAAEKEVAAALDLEMDSPMSVRSLSPRSMANTKVAMQSCAAASESMSMSIELMVASGGSNAEENSSGVDKKQTSAAVAAPPPQLLLPTVRVPPESTTTTTASAAPRHQEVSTPPRTASAAATGHSDSGSDATANSMISFPVSSGAATVEDARQLSVQRDEANDSFAESFMDIFGLTSHPQRLAELRRQVVERVRDARNRSQSGIDSSINSSGFLNTSASRSGGATAATATTTAATASAGAAGGGVTASASSFRVGHGGGTSTTFPSQLSYGDTANISAFSGGRGLTTSVPLVLAHSGAADSHGVAGGGRSTTSSANSTTVNARTGGGGGDSKLNATKGDEIIKDPQRELRAVAEDAADQVMRHNLHVLVYTPRASPEMDEVLGLYGHCTTFVTTPAKMLLYAQAGLQPFDVLIVDWTECLVNAEIHDMLEKRAVDETVVVFFISTRPGVHTPTMNVENVMTDTTVVIHADDLLTGLLARNVLAEVQQLIRRRRLLMSMVDMRMQQSYQIVSHIGSGAFGDVFEVLMFVSHGKLAMKRIFLKSMKLRQLEVINREVCILRSLEHPNIVSFSHTQLEDNAYSIFMELCDGNLADHLLEPTTAIPGVAQRQHYRYGQAYYSGGMASASDATSGGSGSSTGGGGEGGHSGPHSLWGTPLGGGGHAPLSHQHAHHHGGPNMHGNSGNHNNNNNSSSGPALMRPQDAVMIVHDIASALAYLHGRGIIHRDIKPANILFSNGMAKLGDFGSAVKMNESRKLRNMKGTMSYMAPEMVLGEPYTEACDLWSFGCLIASIMGIHLGHLSGLHMPALNELYRSIPMDGSLPLTCSNRFSTKFENHYTDMTTNRVLAALKRALATEMEERAKTPPPPSALRPAHSPYTSPSSSQANVSLGSDTVDEATQERRRVIAELQRADAQSRLRSVTCISTTTIDVLGEFPMQLPASLVELFENLFHRDPARRMTAAELLDHPVSWDVEWMTHMMLEVQKTYAQLSLSTMNARGSPLGAGRGRGGAAAAGGTCGLTGSESEGLNLPGRNAHGSVQPAGYVSYFTESFHGAGEMGGVDLLGGGEAGVNVPCSANDYVLDLSLSGGSGDDSGDD